MEHVKLIRTVFTCHPP